MSRKDPVLEQPRIGYTVHMEKSLCAVLTQGNERQVFEYALEGVDAHEELVVALSRLKEESGAALTRMVEEEKARATNPQGSSTVQ